MTACVPSCRITPKPSLPASPQLDSLLTTSERPSATASATTPIMAAVTLPSPCGVMGSVTVPHGVPGLAQNGFFSHLKSSLSCARFAQCAPLLHCFFRGPVATLIPCASSSWFVVRTVADEPLQPSLMISRGCSREALRSAAAKAWARGGGRLAGCEGEGVDDQCG